MNKTAQLVNEWVAFEASHPNANLEDFYRFRLSQRQITKGEKFLGGVVPPRPEQTLAKMMDRIMKLYLAYASMALKENEVVKHFDDFIYLNAIYRLSQPRKIDVINNNFNELSSGLLIIDRLKGKGYVEEKPNPQDGRAKLLFLTEAGIATLKRCYHQLDEVNKMFFKEVPQDDIQLCTQLLKPLEVKFSTLWVKDKNLSFADIFKREEGKHSTEP